MAKRQSLKLLIAGSNPALPAKVEEYLKQIDPAVAHSIRRWYPALEKLAKE